MSVTPPDIFFEIPYENCVKLINENLEGEDQRLTQMKLAQICGGIMLEAAIDKLSFPPCSTSSDCCNCWVEKWCVHKKTAPALRNQLKELEAFITLPDVVINENIMMLINQADKTEPYDIIGLVATLDILKKSIERKLENDVLNQKQATNPSNEKIRKTTDKMDAKNYEENSNW